MNLAGVVLWDMESSPEKKHLTFIKMKKSTASAIQVIHKIILKAISVLPLVRRIDWKT